ncbi:MAG TPA: polyphosphate polymerase domain-containing protein [Candidatus Limiplasma sp.]|nr:polyphosphate polymerase domain-containing protein [Candidatus Limiplasma sp.]HRX08551.1 polyphosphate polymerase domain-containing protein [Candidatus Limiplasma sp.]
MNKKRFRHELKYLINLPDWALLKTRMAGVMQRDNNVDEHGEYWIRSLYFDDYWHTAFEDKDAGVMIRKKYRLRVYNCSDATIRLERKQKIGPYIHKESAPITRRQVAMLLNGDYQFLEKSDHPLLKEFYFECTSRLMRPRVMVDYDREPYVMEAGDVRITFDKHVRAGFGTFDLFDPHLPAVEVLPANQMIMEVKYTELLPRIVRGLLPPRASIMTAASKYTLCCSAAVRDQNMNRTEGLQWTAR